MALRYCFRDPIPEIADAARYLDAAVSAHLAGQQQLAEALIKLSDIPAIRDWTESIWGAKSPYVQRSAPLAATNAQPRTAARMPTNADKIALHIRDGYVCRFCGIPVIRREIRVHIGKVYPVAAYWGNTNIKQHAAFQAMWAQYDHVQPHSRSGPNELSNLIVTCAPCNFGRMECTLDEVGLFDPRERAPLKSSWDGLERFVV